ncbi:TraR/DksA C4-type zinc finger protein [Peribacillus sp. SCS-155]|uniref:TraR/DksA C4-type zinc finger protein n=1 Tax=Peribacillus sedimenti TaxID=3115297 RepID=UPI0039060272
MISNQDLAKFRDTLNDTKEDLLNRLSDNQDLWLKHSYHEATGNLSSYDNHPGDEATSLYEREKDIGLYEHYRNEISEIDKALKAMQEGTYGKCHVCSEDIPFERLEALPTTLFCIKHSGTQDTSHNRPVEEGVLMPPFGKFEKDTGEDENVAYDAEDTWQAVAAYGTSESPSDLTWPKDDYNDMYEEAEDKMGYVEAYENFVATDITGKHITIYPNIQHERYEDELDAEGIMAVFGDLPAAEHDPYTEEEAKESERD